MKRRHEEPHTVTARDPWANRAHAEPAPGEPGLRALARARALSEAEGIPASACVVAEWAVVQRGARPLAQPVDAEAVGKFFSEWIGGEAQECLAVLAVGNRGEPLGCAIVARGGQGEVSLDARVIYRAALAAGASAIWLSHNHPSGDPSPSDADIRGTAALSQAGSVVGVGIVDHVVCAAGGAWRSIREHLEAEGPPAPGPQPQPQPQPAPSAKPPVGGDGASTCKTCRAPLVALSGAARALLAADAEYVAARAAGYCSTLCAQRAAGGGRRGR